MAVGLRAGTLNRRITFQSRSTARDAEGGQSQVWSPVAVVWAAIEPSAGKELLAAQAMNLDQPSTITVRWQAALADPKTVCAMRIVYGTRIFNIHSAMNQEERNRVLVLIASEGLNNG